jgi:hypothetical protein
MERKKTKTKKTGTTVIKHKHTGCPAAGLGRPKRFIEIQQQIQEEGWTELFILFYFSFAVLKFR